MTFPADPIMLFSVVNTMLRDKYDSLDELCEDNDVEKEYICQKMKAINLFYNEKTNRFADKAVIK